MLKLLSYWPYIAVAAFAAALGYLITAYFYEAYLNRLHNKFDVREAALIQSCEKQTQGLLKRQNTADEISTKASQSYETEISILNGKLAAAKRVRPNACITVTGSNKLHSTGDSSTTDATDTGNVGFQYGIDSDDFNNFRAQSQANTIIGTGLQKFLCEVYRVNGKAQDYAVCNNGQ